MPLRYGTAKFKNQAASAGELYAAPIIATLSGSDTCSAIGVTAQSSSPVLELCRRLIAADHDPRTPLRVYRSNMLCLHVRSIGEASWLRVGGHGIGFERDRECGGSPPVSQSSTARTRQPRSAGPLAAFVHMGFGDDP
jgi:hypothetical protein